MNKTILSIEDEDAYYHLLRIALGETGGEFTLLRAANGEEGLAFLRRTGKYVDAPRPDLIFLDLNMPRVSGPAVLAALKKDPQLKDIPVVVFTCSRLGEHRAECLALGAREFISKPMDYDGVVQAVRTACACLE